MGDLTKNISRHEVACNCGCGFDTIDWLTLTIVQECCDHFAKKLGLNKVTLIVYSGCRCVAWNAHEGGSEDSQHLYGRALDFRVKELRIHDVWEYLHERFPNQFGLSEYHNFIHFDTKSGRRRRW